MKRSDKKQACSYKNKTKVVRAKNLKIVLLRKNKTTFLIHKHLESLAKQYNFFLNQAF